MLPGNGNANVLRVFHFYYYKQCFAYSTRTVVAVINSIMYNKSKNNKIQLTKMSWCSSYL